MRQNNPLRNLFTSPSSREYDERMQYIHLLVTRDAFIALLALIVILPLILQLPVFHSLIQVGIDILFILALPVVALVGLISFFMREGWDWNIQRWRSASWIAVVSLITLGEILITVLAGNGTFSWSFLLPIIGLIVFPLSIIVFTLRKQNRKDNTETTTSRSRRTYLVVLAFIASISFVSLLSYISPLVFSGLSPQRAASVQMFAGGILALFLGVMCLLLALLRTLELPLPRFLQPPAHLAVEQKAIVNRRILVMSLVLLAVAILVLLQVRTMG